MENKKLQVEIFPLAEQDMQDIFQYISVNLSNPSAALRLIGDFENAFDRISSFPESCQLIQNEYVKDKTLRKIIVNDYLVFYRVKNDEIQIIRVIYGMRDYESLL